MKFRFNENRKGLVTVKGLVPDLIKEIHITSCYELQNIIDHWDSIVGSILATHSCPVYKKGKTLFIDVDHPVFANDIIMMKKIIITKIKEILRNDDIHEVKVEVKKDINRRTR